MDQNNETSSRIARLSAVDTGKPRKRVTVLGAGIAGLVAAYELAQLGHEVQIIEAQNRVGGRVWTHYFKNGDYHELGAMRIPKAHHAVRHYVSLFNLSLRRFPNHHDDDNGFYLIRGVSTKHSEFQPKLLPKFRLSPGELHQVRTYNTPLALYGRLIRTATEIKRNPADLAALFGKGPLTETVRRLERQSIYEFLDEKLDTPDGIDLLGAVTGLEVWWDKAITMVLREAIAHSPYEFDEIVGGFSKLPDKLLEALQNRENVDIQLKTEVQRIKRMNDCVKLTLAQASRPSRTRQQEADYVICSIPFAVLRRMRLTGVSEAKLRAIRNLTYTSATKVLFSCRDRFWERHYKILGGGSQLDTISRQIYYPSPAHGSTGDREKGADSASATYDRSGALLAAYCWGADSGRLGSVTHKERVRLVTAAIEQIHPEISQPGMVLDSASMCWEDFRWSAGAFCYLAPDDFVRYYSDAVRPEGRLVFAGEHCSLSQAWMEGAVTSALDAIGHIVAH